MRTLSSVIVGVLAFVALTVFGLLHSVLGYVQSPDAVTQSARDEALHMRVIDIGELILVDEMRSAGLYRDELHDFVRQEARQVFQQVFAPEWFYQAFHQGYASALAVVHGKEPQAIDLREQKRGLRRGLEGVGAKVADRCHELVGTSVCNRPDGREQILRPVERGVKHAVDGIPDSLAIETVARRAGATWLRPDSPRVLRARQVLKIASIVRYVALGALALFFLVIGVSNRTPIRRLLVTMGLAFSGTAILFMVTMSLAEAELEVRVEEAVAGVRTHMQSPDAAVDVGGVAARGAQELTQALAHDAIHGSDALVMGLAGTGIALIILGVVLGRRRPGTRSRPESPPPGAGVPPPSGPSR